MVPQVTEEKTGETHRYNHFHFALKPCNRWQEDGRAAEIQRETSAAERWKEVHNAEDWENGHVAENHISRKAT